MLPVLIVANDAGGTGSVSSVVRNHARELARRGEVILIAATLPEPPIPGVRGVAVSAPQLTWLHRLAHVPREVLLALAIRRAARLECRAQPVVALFAHSHALGALVGRRVQSEFGVPYLLVVHADIHDRPPRTYDPRVTAFYRWATPIAYRFATRILAISNHIARSAIAHGGEPGRVIVVPNGIDPREIFTGELGGGGVAGAAGRAGDFGGPLRLLYVGRLSVEKGVADLIAACALLERRAIAFHLCIVGDGPLRLDLERQTQELGIGERVAFVGTQPRGQLSSFYQGADLVCVPSLSEPQGLVVLEALVAGKPVVASDVGGIPDMVRDGENGRLHPPGHPDRLAEILGKLASDRVALGRLTSHAQLSVIENYSWEAIGRHLRLLLDELPPPSHMNPV